MIKSSQHAQITRFHLARSLAGRGRYWTTCYLVDGVLIDSGCPDTAAELSGALAPAPPHTLINSHTHEDHIGANALLQRANPHLRLLAHPLALPVLADPKGEQPQQLYRRFFWGIPKPSYAKSLADGQIVASDNTNLQVIFSPGHSRDHICLYEPDRGWMFSGDLFNSGRDRALRAGYDIWGIIESLKRIAALPIKTLYPGCARIRQAPGKHLQSKIAYLEELGGHVLDLNRQGHSVSQITRRLLGKPMWIETVTLGHFSRRRLVLSYLKINQQH